jgi:Protein of unknown function (DUF1761)
MTWARFLLAVVAAAVAASFTDWLFMGFLFHGKYLAHPEIWRKKPGESETRGILLSSLLGVASCAAFIFLCRWTGAVTMRSELHLAAIAWIAGPVPILFSNIVWIKMHPLLGVSHSLGWLARFVLSGLAAGWLLG